MSDLLIRQHLIDPEVCIRCNTCEETCPVDAITHDSRNYVVDAAVCNGCNACISPCPTGSIDHWRVVFKDRAYTLAEQFSWDELPVQQETPDAELVKPEAAPQANAATSPTSTIAPSSAATPQLNLFTQKSTLMATVAGNFRLTEPDAESDIRHIVLDFGMHRFPLLEGQSIGIIPSGSDAQGRPHYPRMYSIASPRGGEREGYNNASLTVKRVPGGVGSNYLCDLQKGDTVQITGPFGDRFLMPNHAGSNILMICTGTGSAPMRAMTEHRRRLRAAGQDAGGKLMLFFGARRREELPYFGPLMKLPPEFIDTSFAFSREPGRPRAYVQDRIRERAADVAALLAQDSFVYICGLKGMEEGVLQALAEACAQAGMDWPSLHMRYVREGRFHVETY
ncbi:benzoyl-CoA 2,3-epoxidase subunit BoxA [Piscinibacter terrae]|uniref:Benzoyl-CoA oxygenase component A n=1 Tax=Piscinibacter terrae TaxID=2496871 RepID=A0A3N7HN54_9BURK|nr:benzoyl-CoA 2,3-epoxidase subunit BoxA [Albitalea terrae]RQP22526.1 benzoyl-CoA 2,3-epoxidase subunit BoxA [Albitalea terrae]